MKYQIIGKNIEVTEGISAALTKKLSKMDKYFKDDDEVSCRAVVRSYKKVKQKLKLLSSQKIQLLEPKLRQTIYTQLLILQLISSKVK